MPKLGMDGLIGRKQQANRSQGCQPARGTGNQEANKSKSSAPPRRPRSNGLRRAKVCSETPQGLSFLALAQLSTQDQGEIFHIPFPKQISALCRSRWPSSHPGAYHNYFKSSLCVGLTEPVRD